MTDFPTTLVPTDVSAPVTALGSVLKNHTDHHQAVDERLGELQAAFDIAAGTIIWTGILGQTDPLLNLRDSTSASIFSARYDSGLAITYLTMGAGDDASAVGSLSGQIPGGGTGGDFTQASGNKVVGGNTAEGARFRARQSYADNSPATYGANADAQGGQANVSGDATMYGAQLTLAGGAIDTSYIAGDATLAAGLGQDNGGSHTLVNGSLFLQQGGTNVVVLDATGTTMSGNIGFHAHIPAAQSAAGSTAADAIACLKAHGLMAT